MVSFSQDVSWDWGHLKACLGLDDLRLGWLTMAFICIPQLMNCVEYLLTGLLAIHICSFFDEMSIPILCLLGFLPYVNL